MHIFNKHAGFINLGINPLIMPGGNKKVTHT